MIGYRVSTAQRARWRLIHGNDRLIAVLEAPGDIVGFLLQSPSGFVGCPRIGTARTFQDLETAAAYVETFIPERSVA